MHPDVLSPLYLEDATPLVELSNRSGLSEPEVVLLEAVLRENSLVKGDSADFVGFLKIPDLPRPPFFLPKTTLKTGKCGDSSMVSLAATTLRVLEKYSRVIPRRNEGFDAMEPTANMHGMELLKVAIELLRDWQDNGHLAYAQQESTRGYENKVNWSATIAECTPIISTGNVIYLEPIASRVSANEQHFVSNLHRICVDRAFIIAGWLPEFQGATPEPIIGNGEEARWSTREIIGLLTDAMDHEFSETRIRTLRLIIGMLELRPALKRGIVCGTNAFETVWEEMCSVLLENEWDTSFKHGLPQPRLYEALPGGADTEVPTRIRQRPDIVFNGPKGAIFCVDAKYYDVRFGFPDWKDFAKQFVYVDSLERRYPGSMIYNGFLFPLPSTDYPHSSKLVLERASNNRAIHFDFVSMERVMAAYCTMNELLGAEIRSRLNARLA